MTLKTNNGKTAYLTIAIITIVMTLILSLIYIGSTFMRKVILAQDSEGEVYIVDTNWSCGNCNCDNWYFYGDDGSSKKVTAPLQSDHKFIKVYFNKNHYNRKTKTFTFGSYNETYNRVFSKDFYMISVSDANGFKVYEELDNGYEKKRWFSLLYWAILSGFFIALPLIHIRPSKDFFAELMKYASYIDEPTKFYFNDDKLSVYLAVSPKEVCFSEIYYKKNKVVYHVYVSSNGSLSNVEGSEFYWVKRATKSILPAFKNEMINSKIERIL